MQKELFIKKAEPGSPIGGPGERKLSTSSSSSMKTKWMKAFRSLKPASSSSGAPEKGKNGAAAGNSQMSRMGDITTDNHNLQEYTYKKITPCDVCSQVLRGEFFCFSVPPPPHNLPLLSSCTYRREKCTCVSKLQSIVPRILAENQENQKSFNVT